jgi:hypothetical protein
MYSLHNNKKREEKLLLLRNVDKGDFLFLTFPLYLLKGKTLSKG